MKAILAKRDSPSKTKCYPHGRALRGREHGRKTGCRVGAGVCVKEMGEGQDAGSTGAQGSPGSVTAGLSLAGHSMGHGRSQSGKQSSISLIGVPNEMAGGPGNLQNTEVSTG